MANNSRLLTRATLRAYLGGMPWEEVLARIDLGKLPRPLWKVPAVHLAARWDRRAVDRALDAESAIPTTIEAEQQQLDRALGLA